MSKDYYKILGVAKDANADDIKKAFRKLAHEHHPDKGGEAEKFKEINEAYQVLGNNEKRQKYDRFGSDFANAAGGRGGFEGFSGFNGGNINVDFEDLGDMFGGFGDIFGFGGGRSRNSSRPRRGDDLEMVLALDFKEAVFGLEKEISFERIKDCPHCSGSGAEPGSPIETCKTCSGRGKVSTLQRTILGNIQMESPCPDCHGEGKSIKQKCGHCHGQGSLRAKESLTVKIPAGINNGESIRLSGRGNAGSKGAPSGDLFLRIKIASHKKFQREAYDIRSKEEINIKQAILGDKIEIETIDGKEKLKIPAGTQSGTVFRLRDQGVPRLHSHGRGDHFVEVSVVIPKKLSRHDQNLIDELAL